MVGGAWKVTYVADSAGPGFELERGGCVVGVTLVLPGIPELATDIANLVKVGDLWIGKVNGSSRQLEDVLHGGPDRELEFRGLLVRVGMEFTGIVSTGRGREEAKVLILVTVELVADRAVEARHDMVDVGVVVAALS